MRRGDFEDLVRRYLDGELTPRGFRLTPQPPADWEDVQPRAVYEAAPADFNRRYPALASDDPRCIDLWIDGPVDTDLALQLTELSARLSELLDAATRHIDRSRDVEGR
jgi:hypothetical protein